jgi:hypothetical protein
MASFAQAPKARVLSTGDQVAITIDGNDFPYRSLSVRGHIAVERRESVTPEYEVTSRRYLGETQARAWLDGIPPGTPMWRFTVTPKWANLQDFETRFPSGLVAMMGWAPDVTTS